jgi:bacterial/archaeal transporter family-2 protein
MTEALYILLAFVVGFGSAFQVAMLGDLRGERGSFEASWVNTLGAGTSVAIAIVILGLAKIDPPDLHSPFDKTWVYALAGVAGIVALAFAAQGLPVYLAFVGFFGFSYVLASAFLGPRIGIALYISAVTAGTLIGGVGLDHYGAFGNQVVRVDGLKLLGLCFLMAGVVLIRGR